MRRLLKNRRCTHCATFNRPYRLNCMVCRLPLSGITRCRTRTAAVVRWTADRVSGLGCMAFIMFAVVALVVQNGELDLLGLTPALAAYGLAQVTVTLLDELAERIAPGPTWKEAAKDLREVAQKLGTSADRAKAVDELNHHAGVYPVISILRALAFRARVEQYVAENAGEEQDALGQERMADALIVAARELDADVERAWL